MDFKEVINARYSCKKFSDRPLEKEKLQEILEAGRLAPTAKNLQKQHIYVICSAEKLALIDKETPCRYGAPVVLAVAYRKEGGYTYPGGKYESGSEDMAIIASYMMLAAANLGVNSCWLNRFDPDSLKERLGLPKEEVPVLLMDLGYAAEGAGPLAPHFSRKPLEETISEL